jgi:signal transduction histidine kinase
MKSRFSLRARFLLVLIVLLLAVFGLITLLIVRQDRLTLRNNLITESKSFAALATQQIGDTFVTYQDSGTLKIDQEVSSFTDLDHAIDSVQVINTNGQQLFTNSTTNLIKVNANTAASLSATYVKDGRGNLSYIIQPYVEGYGIHRYDLVYGISYQSVNSSIQSIVTSLVMLSAAILIVSLAGWYFLINWLFLRPVAKVSQIALLISKGDINRQIHLSRNDEIGDLAVAVDTMAQSLQADITKLKKIDQIKSDFLMITAHSLRTPLSIIDAYIDKISSGKSNDDLQSDLKTITSNTTRLKHFAEDALTISTVEENQSHVELKPTDISPLLHTIADEFSDVAKQKNITFKSSITTHAWVALNSSYFHSALWNLLDNAYKFTPKDGLIEMNVVAESKQLVISIKDNGIGIAATEVPQLFTKFHRATDTLLYNYEGMGIGLYLTKLIMEQHGGTISLESTEGSGSTFTVHFPIVPAPIQT